MPGSVVVSGARTPIGRLLGGLSTFSGARLGAHAVSAALERAGLDGERAGEVDYVIMGQVLQAGQGQNPARQSALGAGIPLSVPALTINKVCLSGLNAVALADQLIAAGQCAVVVAGGMESMTGAPHLLPGARTGYKYGSVEVLDTIARDGLTDASDGESMGSSTERFNARLAIGREEQDSLAARSHQRAAAAVKDGRMAAEIAPVRVPQRKGEALVVAEDEGVRADTTAEGLGRLRPAFAEDGTITAGSSSQISDGAAALVVMSRAAAERLGCEPMAVIGEHGSVAGPHDTSLHSQPSNAIRRALDKAGMGVGDLDMIEINEAFASVALQSSRDLGLADDSPVVNPDGGAIALGHPIGASGARLAVHLVYELRRRGGGRGAAGLCGGGGQGDALLFEVAG